MAELKESEFHGCICSKLEKLTIPGADGQSWRSISVCISFGDYKKMFEIDKKDLLLPAEIGNIPGNTECQVNESIYEGPQDDNNVEQQSESAVNIPIVQTTSNQDPNDQSAHISTTRRYSRRKRKPTGLYSESEPFTKPNVSPLPTHSASRIENRPKVKTLRIKTSTAAGKNKTYDCPTCSMQCSRKSNLIIHQKLMHSDEQSKANWKHECNICSNKFLYLTNLNRHKLVHTKKRQLKCLKCPSTFKYKRDFVMHLITHAKDSPFRCKMCQKVLSSLPSLESHTRTHTGEKPYQCQFCDKSFAQGVTLKRHMRKVHIS